MQNNNCIGIDMETWKPVPGYGGYEISDRGRIRRTVTRLIKPTPIIRGDGTRFVVGLKKNGKSKQEQFHRLLLSAFISPPPSKTHQARHLDGNPSNNKLDNLAWGTPTENQRDRKTHGTDSSGSKNGGAKLTTKQAALVRREYKSGKSPSAIASAFGITPQQVWSIGTGRSWKCLK